MRIEKAGQAIACVDDWKRLAPPKSGDHWVPGRSAFELANAWCGGAGGPAMPVELRALLDSSDQTRGLEVETVFPEHRIPFDEHGGEPRNADLAFVGATTSAKVAVTVEAKADEPFGSTVGQTLSDALERLVVNPRSGGVPRVADLVRALFRGRSEGQPFAHSLRYQLLTAVAGSLAFAVSEGASVAVLVVHEFVTDKTRDERHQQNADDLRLFTQRLSGMGVDGIAAHRLVGPFAVPGEPLFPSAPPLFVGKITTNRRGQGA